MPTPTSCIYQLPLPTQTRSLSPCTRASPAFLNNKLPEACKKFPRALNSLSRLPLASLRELDLVIIPCHQPLRASTPLHDCHDISLQLTQSRRINLSLREPRATLRQQPLRHSTSTRQQSHSYQQPFRLQVHLSNLQHGACTTISADTVPVLVQSSLLLGRRGLLQLFEPR